MEREELLRVSNKNFKFVQDSGMKKYRYMDSWCFEYSKFLRNEVNVRKDNDKSKKKNYKSYKKGTIIYAKLGINIGREFSGNHFCVVLNKKDSSLNPILTVVPLTSSSTRYNIEIKEELLQLATTLLYKQSKAIADKLIEQIRQIEESENPDDPHLLKVTKQLEDESNQLFKVFDRYERYRDTKTYANILNITTISKDRISKINTFDPSGEMIYSQDTMSKIDKSISNRFLN